MTHWLALPAIGLGLCSIGIGIGWAAARHSIGKRQSLVRRNGALWATSPVVDAEFEEIRAAFRGDT